MLDFKNSDFIVIFQENQDYVLKKIECEDENAARKAFQEAMALSELKHPNICGYKEFFVNWDKECSYSLRYL